MKRVGLAALCLVGFVMVAVWTLMTRSVGSQSPDARDLVLEDLGRPAVPRLARKINEIHEFGGKLYLGFGDWVENSGPTDVITFDPKSRVFRKEFRTPEHAIVRFRELDGKLAIPGIDGVGPQGNLMVLEEEGWNVHPLGSDKTSHVYDIASFDGRWFAGVDGRVLASDDRGKKWQLVHDARNGLAHQTRVVCLAVQHEKLYVFPVFVRRGGFRILADARGPAEADVWDGVDWTRRDILPPGYERCVAATGYAGDLVTYSYHALPDTTRKVGILQRFDGMRSEILASPFHAAVQDLETPEGQLLLLGKVDGAWKLGVTRNLSSWTVWSIPDQVRPLSAWIHDGRIYLGGDDGHLHRQVDTE